MLTTHLSEHLRDAAIRFAPEFTIATIRARIAVAHAALGFQIEHTSPDAVEKREQVRKKTRDDERIVAELFETVRDASNREARAKAGDAALPDAT